MSLGGGASRPGANLRPSLRSVEDGQSIVGMGVRKALAWVVLGFLGLVLTSSLPTVMPLGIPSPDIVLLVVVYVGLSARGGFAGALGLAALLGYFADLSTGSPKGLHMLADGLLALAARGASARLLVRGRLFTMLVAGLFAALGACLLLGIERVLGTPLTLAIVRACAGHCLATAVVAPLVFRVLAGIDRRFTNDPHLPRAGASVRHDTSTLGMLR